VRLRLSEAHANAAERRHLPVRRRRRARIGDSGDLLIAVADARRGIARRELIDAGKIDVGALGQHVVDAEGELMPARLERRAVRARKARVISI